MKKAYYKYLSLLILALPAAFIINSCTKKLDQQNPNQQTVETFWQSQDDAIKGVNAIYSTLIEDGTFMRMTPCLLDARGDDVHSNSPWPVLGNMGRFSLGTGDPGGYGWAFSDYYEGVNRANQVLAKVPDINMDADLKTRLLGQAYFLRGLYFYYLVDLFGQVALPLQTATSTADFHVPQSTAEQGWQQVISDFKQAVDMLPASYSNVNGPDKGQTGRATKGAAMAFLGKAYLFNKLYDDAATQFKSVIDLNVYSLVPNYADNFNINKENGPESIFEVQYIEGNNGLSSDFVDTFCPWDVYDDSVTGYEIENGAQNGWNIPTQDMLDAYEQGDKRRAASLNEDFISDEWGYLVPYVIKFNSIAKVQFQTGNNFPVYRYADVYLMLAESLNEAGYEAGGDAFHYLNLVRERAGLADKTSATVPDQASLRLVIAHERQVELAFENHRWFDLLRTGTATTVMQAHAAREKQIKASYINSAAYANIRLVYQYPASEQQLEQ